MADPQNPPHRSSDNRTVRSAFKLIENIRRKVSHIQTLQNQFLQVLLNHALTNSIAPSQPPKQRRAFGTDLTNSLVSNSKSASSTLSHSQKKKVRVVRKQYENKNHVSDFRKQASKSPQKHVSSAVEASDLEYDVAFQPGPIGLKLEPVVVSGNREIGCRVMKFIDAGVAAPGQARASGKIRPGDLLIAVDGQDVISWNYPDVITYLKLRPSSLGRQMTFRSVWEPPMKTSNNQVPTNPLSDTTPLKKPPPNPEQGRRSSVGLLSPSEAAFSHVLTSFCQDDQAPQSSQLHPSESNKPMKNFIAPQDLSILSIAESSIGPNASMMSAPQSFIVEDREEQSVFSPSRVKKLSSTVTQHDRTASPPRKQISKVLSTVYNSVAPAAGIVAVSSYNVTSTLTSVMSTKLGEALVGHSSREFDQAIQLKMKLLTELSQAKVTLDAKEEEQARLHQSIQQLSEDKARETMRLEQELDFQKVRLVVDVKSAYPFDSVYAVSHAPTPPHPHRTWPTSASRKKNQK